MEESKVDNRKAVQDYLEFMQNTIELAKANTEKLEEILTLEGVIVNGELSPGFLDYKEGLFEELAITKEEKEDVTD